MHDGCDHPVWIAGDSYATAIAERIDGTFAVGTRGAGYLVEHNGIGATLLPRVATCRIVPAHIVLVGGVNDLADGCSVEEIRTARDVLVKDLESLGTRAWVLTQPHWRYPEVEALNWGADLEVSPAGWGPSDDGIHPVDFGPFVLCVRSWMRVEGIL